MRTHTYIYAIYVCMYLVLSTTDQAKAVEEVTQHVSETTSEDSEQNVGETTRGRNDCILATLC